MHLHERQSLLSDVDQAWLETRYTLRSIGQYPEQGFVVLGEFDGYVEWFPATWNHSSWLTVNGRLVQDPTREAFLALERNANGPVQQDIPHHSV